ncbi:MAG: Tn3 family transposase [Pseudonocardiaceae bacterium]
MPQEAQLGGFFHLGAEDRRRAVAAHGARNQLGWSVQLGTLRFLGTFLADPESAPVVVIGYVADQLGLDPAALKGYGEKEARWDHQAQIRDLYGYTAFGTIQWLGLARWLYRRAWHANERPSVLFDLATHRLVEAKILLPGVSTLERLVAGIRDRAAARTYRVLAAAPNPAQRAALEALVVVEPGQRMSALDRHRRSPVDISGKGVVKALARYEALRGFGAQTWDLSEVPPGRVHGLARFAKAARAQAVAELSPDRRLATLAAFATVMEPTAADEAIEVVDLVIGDLVRTAGFRAARQRLRTLKDLDVAALILREAWLAITQDAAAGRDVAARMAAMDIAAINSAAAVVAELAREPDEDIQPELTERYATIRRFLPRLLKVINFAAAGPQGQHLLQALDFLPDIDKRRGLIHRDEPPTEFLTPAWYRRVFPTQGEKAGGFDKRAYTVAAAERLRETLRRHEVFVPGLRKWGDPTAGLLHGAAWDKAREPICRDLGLSPEPGPDIDIWAARLDACYRQLADGLAENPSVRIEVRDGRDHLVLTGLDKLDEPDSLTALRADVDARIPTLDLPEAILEVHSWTGFLDHFTHVSDTPTRTPDMTTSVAAVLAAQAMNVGMGPMVHDGNPALALDRLFWAEQNYLRADTLSSANAALVEYHSRLPLVEAWGGGELASADGLRFVVPVKTINAGPNPKFFGKGKGARGATYYNFTSDQFLGFHAIVVPGTRGVVKVPTTWCHVIKFWD